MSDDQSPNVRNVGALASLSPDASEDPDWAIVELRLFARTDGGEEVVDPQTSTTVRIERTKLAALELSVQMSLRLRQAPTGPRREAWQRIADELATRGITTDPEALHPMKFDFRCDDELRAAQQAVWPRGH